MKILFVENHALFAATVVEQFLCSHEVTVVPTVTAALEAVDLAAFDVLLVDYDLDDGKGDRVVRHVCARGIDVTIVAVSARPEGNQAMIDAGADTLCHKRDFARIEREIASAQIARQQRIEELPGEGDMSGELVHEMWEEQDGCTMVCPLCQRT